MGGIGVKEQATRNSASHELHKLHWEREKRTAGKWLSKSEYQRKTGQAGRK